MDLRKNDENNNKETIYEDDLYTTSSNSTSSDTSKENINSSFSQYSDIERMEELSRQSTILHDADDGLNNSGPSSYEIISFILGIISLVTCCCCSGLNIIFGIVGIVFASLAKKENGKHRQSGIGKAGEVCSITGTVIAAVILVYMISQIIMAGGITEFIDEQEKILKENGYEIDLMFKLKCILMNIIH